jgi:hypothetical protein
MRLLQAFHLLPPAAALGTAPPDENRGFDVDGRAGADFAARDDGTVDADDVEEDFAATLEGGALDEGALASAIECIVSINSRMRRASS